MARQHRDARVAAGRTLIRRYVLALPPAGAGNEAAVTATSVPPLSGGPGSHGSGAAHAFTIADGVGGDLLLLRHGVWAAAPVGLAVSAGAGRPARPAAVAHRCGRRLRAAEHRRPRADRPGQDPPALGRHP